MNTSPAIKRAVLDALPGEAPGLVYSEIFARVGVWSPITIKHALRALRDEGKVIKDTTAFSMPRFWRAA